MRSSQPEGSAGELLAAQVDDEVRRAAGGGERDAAELATAFLGMLATGQLPQGQVGGPASAAYYVALAPRVVGAFVECWPVIAPALRSVRRALLSNPAGHVAFEDSLLQLVYFGMLAQAAIERPCISSSLFCQAMDQGIAAILAAGIPATIGDEEEGHA